MANVHVGDCIILTKPDGRCDLFEVDESGERVRVRENLASLHQAWQIAPLKRRFRDEDRLSTGPRPKAPHRTVSFLSPVLCGPPVAELYPAGS
jgi:hypothetical protein